MIDKDRIAREDNESLIARFVAAVGNDYHEDYSPHLYPDFSENTVALWEEIENRLNAPTCLTFDRDGCLKDIKDELKKQEGILKNGVTCTTSYHVGIKSGLNLAWSIIEKHIKREEKE